MGIKVVCKITAILKTGGLKKTIPKKSGAILNWPA